MRPEAITDEDSNGSDNDDVGDAGHLSRRVLQQPAEISIPGIVFVALPDT